MFVLFTLFTLLPPLTLLTLLKQHRSKKANMPTYDVAVWVYGLLSKKWDGVDGRSGYPLDCYDY